MAEVLIAARDLGGFKKGFPIVVFDSPHNWGGKEIPPDFVRLSIADATAAQVEHFLYDWPIRFVYEILAENAFGWRIKISVDPAYISLSGMNAEQIKSTIQLFVQENWNAQVTDFTTSSMTVEVPKPGDLPLMKSGFEDIFNDQFDLRRYRFSVADVDLAISQGGDIELTKQQALNRIIDRLVE